MKGSGLVSAARKVKGSISFIIHINDQTGASDKYRLTATGSCDAECLHVTPERGFVILQLELTAATATTAATSKSEKYTSPSLCRYIYLLMYLRSRTDANSFVVYSFPYNHSV